MIITGRLKWRRHDRRVIARKPIVIFDGALTEDVDLRPGAIIAVDKVSPAPKLQYVGAGWPYKGKTWPQRWM